MARAASAWVSVRGSPARSAISLHPSGMRTRASSAREGRASSSRAIAASTAGIPGYLADIPDGLIAERKVAPFRLCRQGRAGDATSIRTVLPIILIIAPAKRRVCKSGLPDNSENGYLAGQIGSHSANSNSTRKNAPARRPFRASQFVPWLASIRTRRWTRKDAYRPGGRNYPPVNSAPRRTICPAIDREQRRQLWFLLR